LRPFPSCAIVQLTAPGGALKPLPRGSRLETRPVKGVPYTFTTAYDVAPGRVILAEARFDALVQAPAATRLPAAVSSAVSLTFRAPAGAALPPDHPPLRLYIDGDPSFCATLRDVLFMRTACAYAQCGAAGP
jgi:type VI secretion system protein ImpG